MVLKVHEKDNLDGEENKSTKSTKNCKVKTNTCRCNHSTALENSRICSKTPRRSEAEYNNIEGMIEGLKTTERPTNFFMY